MNMCLPIAAKRSEFVQQIILNPNINVYYFNSYGDNTQLADTAFKFKLWDYNLISWLAQTVINTAVQMAINLRYDEIILVGADTSWHTTYEMDQETNTLYTIDSHFYGHKKIPVFEDSECMIHAKLNQELSSVANALKGYCILEQYAKYAGVKVYNASEFSWIDAFERIKI